jgi:hypothetical protein
MPEDKRQHLRLPAASKVFIELVATPAGSSEPGTVALCNTLDISRGGLRLSLDQELTVGAILQIGVQLSDADDVLYLAGEVRWCRPLQESQHGWCAGFKLMNAGDSDIDSWIALLSNMDRSS